MRQIGQGILELCSDKQTDKQRLQLNNFSIYVTYLEENLRM